MGRRLIVYPNGRRMFIDFVRDGGATLLNSKFLEEPAPASVQRCIEIWNTANDGHASKRIVDFMETLI